jgi:hypothetical protein
MQEQQQVTPALYSTKLPTKSQTYFFDVKKAKNGNRYITITQSRIWDGKPIRNSVIIFEDQIEAFNHIFTETAGHMK